MITTRQSQMRRDAESIAREVLIELGDPRLRNRLQTATIQIEDIVSRWQRLGKTETVYARWVECVHWAALQIARSGQLPGGMRLDMLSEKRFIGIV